MLIPLPPRLWRRLYRHYYHQQHRRHRLHSKMNGDGTVTRFARVVRAVQWAHDPRIWSLRIE